MVGLDVVMGDGLDPVACSVLELPMPVLHGLGNGLSGSDIVLSGQGCLRLSGLLANVGLVFFEDMRSGFTDAARTATRLGYFTSLVAGSSWTRDVLQALPAHPAGPRLVLSSAFTAAKRQNLTLHTSSDGGHTWSAVAQVYAGAAAYSSLVAVADGAVAVAFERDGYQAIAVAASVAV